MRIGYLFYVSFAGLGLGLDLVTAGLDYNTGRGYIEFRLSRAILPIFIYRKF